MSALKLERRDQADETPTIEFGGAVVAITPALNEDYWSYRVLPSPAQAIVGFPKFFTISIGFAVEEDWNTNLPYTCETEEIFKHIEHSKGDDAISDDDVREAIRLVQEAVIEDRAAGELIAMRAAMAEAHGHGRGARAGGVVNAPQVPDAPRMYTPAEVARMFRVTAPVVARWAREGKLTAVKTPGGHRRYDANEVGRWLRGES